MKLTLLRNLLLFDAGILLLLGALFILVTLLLQKGIIGTFNAWWEGRKARQIAANAESADLEDGVGEPKPAE
jgi:urea transport system permease protein